MKSRLTSTGHSYTSPSNRKRKGLCVASSRSTSRSSRSSLIVVRVLARVRCWWTGGRADPLNGPGHRPPLARRVRGDVDVAAVARRVGVAGEGDVPGHGVAVDDRHVPTVGDLGVWEDEAEQGRAVDDVDHDGPTESLVAVHRDLTVRNPGAVCVVIEERLQRELVGLEHCELDGERDRRLHAADEVTVLPGTNVGCVGADAERHAAIRGVADLVEPGGEDGRRGGGDSRRLWGDPDLAGDAYPDGG